MLKHILLISNIYLAPYWNDNFKVQMDSISHYIHTDCTLYEEYAEYLEQMKSAQVVVVCINFDELYPDISTDSINQKDTWKEIELL